MKSVVSELVSWMDVPSGLEATAAGQRTLPLAAGPTSFFPAARRAWFQVLRVARALGDRPIRFVEVG